MKLEYIRAEDFDRAWLNFEADLPLEPLAGGASNPFYVARPGNAIDRLHESLNAPFFKPPKLFFSGHRGCGKSTELRRLAVNPDILERYYPIHFTIRDEADIYNLDFKDVLLAIGGRLIREYTADGKELPIAIDKELDRWRGAIQEEIVHGSRIEDIEFDVGLNTFFASTGLKMKLEPATRHTVRQVIERHVTGLMQVIDQIAAAICEKENRMPLVLIDDLDKPDLNTAQAIFHGHRESMLQPNCAIVYTVSSPLFYSPEFEAIRDRAIFLPNIKLHAQGQARADRTGYRIMREFVSRRMNPDLIGPRALNTAIALSGGVFREMARIMRESILQARRAGVVHLDHIHAVESEIRGEYRRLLSGEQRAIMRQVHLTNRLDEPQKIAPLLQMLAVLEYADNEPWCDVHPVLLPLLMEDGAYQNAQIEELFGEAVQD